MRQPKLFSYVVGHDHGFAPNPVGQFCTLVHCKFSRNGKRNVVETAESGDWILGMGGQSSHSSGNGTIVYIMRVDEKLPFSRYMRDRRFAGRLDHCDTGKGNKFALISKHFFYFGRKAMAINSLPEHLRSGLEKRGPGFRSDLPSELIKQLIESFENKFETGMHGYPCSPLGLASIEEMPRRFIPGTGSLCRTKLSSSVALLKSHTVCI